APASRVVREPVRMWPDGHLTDQLLARAVKDAHAGAGAVAREEEIVVLIDQDSGHAWQVGQRVKVALLFAVDDVDAVGAGVGDVEAPAGVEEVGVVEPGLSTRRHRDEADALERHVSAWEP